jgi:O-antigen/teichoic acid export membrane protein
MAISRARLAQIARSGLMRQIAEQAAANIAVQALGAITTLSFVHLLPTTEYAVFGLCVSTVGFISMTSDLGLMAAMNFFWRSEVAGGEPFAERYAAIRRLRLILFAISGTAACSVLAWLEHRQGVPTMEIAITVVLVLLLAWAQILAAMIVLSLRLGQQLRRAYQVELVGALVRAGLAVTAFVLALRHAWFPLAGLGAASLVTLMMARSRVPQQFRTLARPTSRSIRNLVAYILPTMPATLLFSTQDIFVYWLATLSGGTTVMAQTFALGRLAAIFITLNSIMANVIIPRIVNLADDSHARRNGAVSIATMAAFCAALTVFAALFPDLVLMVLGKNYADLQVPLVLALSASSMQLVAQALGQFNRTMGWVRLETPMMIFHGLAIVALVPFFHFGTARDVLTFNLVLAMLGLAEMITVHLVGPRGLVRSGGSKTSI